MSKRYLILLVVAIAFNSCNQILNKTSAANSLTWKDENIVVKEIGCEELSCALADFRYVIFSGLGADSLNKQVNELMGSSFMDDSLIVSNPKTSAEKFIAAFEANKKDFPEDSARWMLDREIRPDSLFENVITLRYDESSFSGGAHGMYFTIFNHFQLSPFKTLWLADFLNNPEDTILVTALAEAIFRDKQELGSDERLEEAGYFFAKGVFKLNENFHFTEQGLAFHFNIYEIQPYASGEYKLLVPYDKIERFLKPSIFKIAAKS